MIPRWGLCGASWRAGPSSSACHGARGPITMAHYALRMPMSFGVYDDGEGGADAFVADDTAAWRTHAARDGTEDNGRC
jgi:hypothetical protein